MQSQPQTIDNQSKLISGNFQESDNNQIIQQQILRQFAFQQQIMQQNQQYYAQQSDLIDCESIFRELRINPKWLEKFNDDEMEPSDILLLSHAELEAMLPPLGPRLRLINFLRLKYRFDPRFNFITNTSSAIAASQQYFIGTPQCGQIPIITQATSLNFPANAALESVVSSPTLCSSQNSVQSNIVSVEINSQSYPLVQSQDFSVNIENNAKSPKNEILENSENISYNIQNNYNNSNFENEIIKSNQQNNKDSNNNEKNTLVPPLNSNRNDMISNCNCVSSSFANLSLKGRESATEYSNSKVNTKNTFHEYDNRQMTTQNVGGGMNSINDDLNTKLSPTQHYNDNIISNMQINTKKRSGDLHSENLKNSQSYIRHAVGNDFDERSSKRKRLDALAMKSPKKIERNSDQNNIDKSKYVLPPNDEVRNGSKVLSKPSPEEISDLVNNQQYKISSSRPIREEEDNVNTKLSESYDISNIISNEKEKSTFIPLFNPSTTHQTNTKSDSLRSGYTIQSDIDSLSAPSRQLEIFSRDQSQGFDQFNKLHVQSCVKNSEIRNSFAPYLVDNDYVYKHNDMDENLNQSLSFDELRMQYPISVSGKGPIPKVDCAQQQSFSNSIQSAEELQILAGKPHNRSLLPDINQTGVSHTQSNNESQLGLNQTNINSDDIQSKDIQQKSIDSSETAAEQPHTPSNNLSKTPSNSNNQVCEISLSPAPSANYAKPSDKESDLIDSPLSPSNETKSRKISSENQNVKSLNDIKEEEFPRDLSKPSRILGKIIFFNSNKGFGFISDMDDKLSPYCDGDIYFNRSALLCEPNELVTGSIVEFEAKLRTLNENFDKNSEILNDLAISNDADQSKSNNFVTKSKRPKKIKKTTIVKQKFLAYNVKVISNPSKKSETQTGVINWFRGEYGFIIYQNED